MLLNRMKIYICGEMLIIKKSKGLFKCVIIYISRNKMVLSSKQIW